MNTQDSFIMDEFMVPDEGPSYEEFSNEIQPRSSQVRDYSQPSATTYSDFSNYVK